jgi:hypothetical protein
LNRQDAKVAKGGRREERREKREEETGRENDQYLRGDL